MGSLQLGTQGTSESCLMNCVSDTTVINIKKHDHVPFGEKTIVLFAQCESIIN